MAAELCASCRVQVQRSRIGEERRAEIATALADGPLTTAEIAARCHLTGSGARYQLRAMEADSQVTRDHLGGRPAPRWSLTRKARRP